MSRIKDKLPLDFNVIADNAVALAKRQFKFSEQKLYKTKENSESKIGADYCILDIHDANVPYTEEALLKVYSSIWEIIMGIPSIIMPDGKMLLLEFLSKASFIILSQRRLILSNAHL